MDKQITILGFAGSLRKGSYNKALIRAALELSPEEAKLEIFDLEGIPPYNMDLEDRMPERVKEFKEKEIFVTFAADKIDDKGRVRDEKTREKIKELLESLIAWTRKLKGG